MHKTSLSRSEWLNKKNHVLEQWQEKLEKEEQSTECSIFWLDDGSMVVQRGDRAASGEFTTQSNIGQCLSLLGLS